MPRPPLHHALRLRSVLLAIAVAAGPFPAALAQEAQAPPDDTLRLFQRFAEDGAIAPHVWLEGQGRFQTNTRFFGDVESDRWAGLAVLGLGLTEELEVGLRLGLIQVDPDEGASENGLTDLEVHVKYRLDELPSSIVVGGVVKLPTADEEHGLGTGKVDLEGFGAVRKDLGHVTLIGNAGLRINQDPDVPGEIDGELSLLLGGGMIIGLTARVYNSWEITYESKRYEGAESDSRLTPGLTWRVGNRGVIRAAIGLGLSDGAPDFEAIIGAALTY
jgi:hypothetical protein